MQQQPGKVADAPSDESTRSAAGTRGGRGTYRLLGWRPRDPGNSALRRAARAALVIPLALAFALFVLRNAQMTIYVSFGCFALLVLGDFGGLRRPRAAAYLGTTFVGVLLIALGTLTSFSPWVGAPTMLLVGFAVSFAGVFGGYVTAAQSPLLLAFVLSVALPAPPGAIPARLAGWGIAGAISMVASVVLWPRFERSTLRSQAAVACRALAALVRVTRVRPEGGGACSGAGSGGDGGPGGPARLRGHADAPRRTRAARPRLRRPAE